MSHYEVLGLKAANGLTTATISADDIKKAYRKMAIKYHPDKQVPYTLNPQPSTPDPTPYALRPMPSTLRSIS